jgi:hypothetical protein
MVTKKFFFRLGSFVIKDGSEIRFWDCTTLYVTKAISSLGEGEEGGGGGGGVAEQPFLLSLIILSARPSRESTSTSRANPELFPAAMLSGEGKGKVPALVD